MDWHDVWPWLALLGLFLFFIVLSVCIGVSNKAKESMLTVEQLHRIERAHWELMEAFDECGLKDHPQRDWCYWRDKYKAKKGEES